MAVGRHRRRRRPAASGCCWLAAKRSGALHAWQRLPQEQQPQSATGLFQSLSNFAGTLVAIAHTRLQLLTTELQEEVRQVGAILLWAFIAAFAAMMALFLAALAVIFVFWDTHRIAASLAMIGAVRRDRDRRRR